MTPSAALEALRGRRLALLVQIAGLEDRYYCGPAPDLTSIEGTGGVMRYRDVEAIVDIGAEESSVDEVTCVAEQSPVTVTLRARSCRVSDVSRVGLTHTVDPAVVLRRIGPAADASRTSIVATVPDEVGLTSIECADDVSTWTGLAHIGLEAVHIGAAVGTTLSFCTRGAAETRIARHVYQPTRGAQPTVTQYPVYWRGRQASVYAAPVVEGVRGAYVEVWRGVLDREPSIAGGDTVSIAIAPLTALLSQRIAPRGALSTTVVRDWHYITPAAGSQISVDHVWAIGSLYSSLWGPSGRGPASVDIADGYPPYATMTDLALPDTHPRGGAVLLSIGDASAPVRYGVAARGSVFGVSYWLELTPPAVAPAIAVGLGTAPMRSPAIAEACTLSLVDPAGVGELVRWPDRLLQVIAGSHAPAVAWNDPAHDCDRWRVATTAGRLGRTIAVDLAQDGGGWAFRAWGVGRMESRSEATLRWLADSPAVCLGLDYRAPDDTGALIDLAAGRVSIRRATVTDDDTVGHIGTHRCRGPARAWVQSGEEYMITVDDVFAGGPPQVMRISGGDEVSWGSGAYDVVVSGSSPVTDPLTGDAIGYLLALDWTPADLYALDHGGAPITVTPYARSRATPPPRLALRVLMSSAGTGRTHAVYDALPYGAGLTEADVHVASFEAVASPAGLAEADMDIPPDATVRDVIRSAMTLLGACIVQRWVEHPTARQRLACVPIGAALAADSIMSITDSDVVGGAVSSMVDGRVVRSYRLLLDHDAAGTPQQVVSYVDSDAVDAAGGDAGEVLELDLRGLRVAESGLDTAAALMPIIQHMRRRAGVPRVRLTVTVGMHVPGAHQVQIGDTVIATFSEAQGIDGTYGITSEPCRVLGVRRSWGDADPSITLTLAPAGIRPAGYVPSWRVAAVVSPTVVDLELSSYTGTVHPATGEAMTDQGTASDAMLRVGDVVRCIPAGDYGASLTRTVTVIAGVRVTLSAAHGLAVGDDIDHASYDDASAHARRYCYVADAAGTLGASSARGYDVG